MPANKTPAEINQTATGLSEFVKKNLSNTLVFTEQQFVNELQGKFPPEFGKMDCFTALNILIVTGYVRINDTGNTIFTYNFTQILSKRIRNLSDRLDIIRAYLTEMETRVKRPDMDANMRKDFTLAIEEKRNAILLFDAVHEYLKSQ